MTPIANATPTFPLQMAPTADRGKGFSGIMDFQDSAGRVMGHMQYYVGYIALFMCVLMAGFLVYTYFSKSRRVTATIICCCTPSRRYY